MIDKALCINLCAHAIEQQIGHARQFIGQFDIDKNNLTWNIVQRFKDDRNTILGLYNCTENSAN